MSTTEIVDEQQAYVLPSAQQTYSDPAVELTARNLLASYFGTPDQPGLIGQQIPIPIQQIAGLSPLEIQARNMAQGLGGFGGQLAEAEGLYRQAAQGFDPASAGVFGDPQARALYMQSLGQYDPRMAQQFLDQESRALMRGAARDTTGIDRDISREISQAQGGIRGAEAMIRQGAQSSADEAAAAQRMALEARGQAGREADIGQSAMRRAASNIGTGISQAKTESRYQEREGLSEAQRLAQQLGSIGSEAGAGARQGEAAIAQAARGIKPQVSAGQRQSLQAESLGMAGAQRLGSQLSNIGREAGAGAAVGERAIAQAARGIRPEVTGAQRGSLEAVQRARLATDQAGRDLRSAGQMGRSAAERGISALSGTGGQFDPSSISRFMDPFTQQVIEAEQAEIARLGEKQKRDARSQAVRAGAFGGSRQGIEQAEIGRNILEQQARTGAQLRSQGYQQAAQAAQQAFEQAQGRQQNLAQLTGSLGQAGAGTSLQAAQAAGTLGLSAEELAQSGAMQRGQLGMTGRMNEAQLAEQAASLGISADQLRAQLANQAQQAQMGAAQMQQSGAMQRAQLGMTGQMNEAQLAERAANLGISTDQLRAQLAQQGQAATQAGRQMSQAGAFQRAQIGTQGQQAQANIANQAAQMGISTEQLRAQLGQQAFDTARQQGQLGMQAGQNIGALAGQRGQLGLSGAQARLGSAGQRADIGQGMGSQYGQAQQMGMGSYQDQMRRMQGAAGGLGGLTQDQFGTALQAYGAGTAAQRAGAAGIAGLGQQGYNMLTGQIETMAGLGQTGRGIQDRAYGAQYTAATQMADEPYMRLQRGQQMLGGLSGYLPQYQSGYGTATRGVSGEQNPGTAGKIAGFLGFAGDAYKFGKGEGWWGGGG
jgi:hypothetical protein